MYYLKVSITCIYIKAVSIQSWDCSIKPTSPTERACFSVCSDSLQSTSCVIFCLALYDVLTTRNPILSRTHAILDLLYGRRMCSLRISLIF